MARDSAVCRSNIILKFKHEFLISVLFYYVKIIHKSYLILYSFQDGSVERIPSMIGDILSRDEHSSVVALDSIVQSFSRQNSCDLPPIMVCMLACLILLSCSVVRTTKICLFFTYSFLKAFEIFLLIVAPCYISCILDIRFYVSIKY
jgi:hypothetical protein